MPLDMVIICITPVLYITIYIKEFSRF